MRPPHIPAAVLLFAALFVWSVAPGTGAPYTTESIVEGANDFETLAKRFEELAHAKGGVHAFDVLREAALPPNIDMHLMGHRIGDILYEQEGIEGIAHCTDEFRNACSHTMVIGALTDFGESALPEIREACKRAPGGLGAYTMCYHGLGHGVFAYYGYSIPETVAMCEKTGSDEYRRREVVECIGGAVMELAGGGGHDRGAWLRARAEYIDADPVGFCLSDLVPDGAKSQCLTYMTPELWKRVGMDLGQPDPALYDEAFALCDVIPRTSIQLRDACYGGFGKEFVPLAAARDIRMIDRLSDAQYRDAIRWCMAAEDPTGTAACVEQALHSIFWGGENDPAASFRFCALLDEQALRERCESVLAGNIDQYLRGDARVRWCSELPPGLRDRCA